MSRNKSFLSFCERKYLTESGSRSAISAVKSIALSHSECSFYDKKCGAWFMMTSESWGTPTECQVVQFQVRVRGMSITPNPSTSTIIPFLLVRSGRQLYSMLFPNLLLCLVMHGHCSFRSINGTCIVVLPFHPYQRVQKSHTTHEVQPKALFRPQQAKKALCNSLFDSGSLCNMT